MARRRDTGSPVRVCFVCLGNICRSPTAEAVMRELVRDFALANDVDVDSAGTAGWHIGQAPDQRAVEEAARHGICIVHRGRQFTRRDFEDFDLVLAMDHDNRSQLLRLAPDGDSADTVRFLRTFDLDAEGAQEILDPYYGSAEDFARAFDEIDASCRGLLQYLQKEFLG